MCGATDADMHNISKVFNIHPLTIEDIQEAEDESREKVEMYENYMFFACKCLHYAPSKQRQCNLEYASIFLIVYDNCILSFHKKQLKSIKTVIGRTFAVQNVFEMTPEWILYALLDATTDEYKPTIRNVESQVDSIEETILENFSFNRESQLDPLMCRIAGAKRTVTKLNRLLVPKAEMIKDLLRKNPSRFQEYTMLYLRDILDHALRMLQQLDSYSESLERSHNNYLAQISIELSEASNRLNTVMKKMTACTIVIMPLNLIASIWGMNVTVPGYGQSTNYIPFFAILLFMSMAVIITAGISRHFHWF